MNYVTINYVNVVNDVIRQSSSFTVSYIYYITMNDTNNIYDNSNTIKNVIMFFFLTMRKKNMYIYI